MSFSSQLKERVRPIALPIWLRLWDFPLWRQIVRRVYKNNRKRSFQAYGVGLPKTGTKSLARMLAAEHRSAHEPETWIATHFLGRNSVAQNTPYTNTSCSELFKARDALLALEFESNWVLGLAIEGLYSTFPDAKYILTIRDCISWINSEINQKYVIGHRQPWRILSDYRYGPMRVYRPEEIKLSEYNLYPVRSYFRYWSDHISLVLNTVPEDNLLVVRTRDLSSELGTIAEFLDIPLASLDVARSHSHKRTQKPLNIHDLVDPDYLSAQAELYCKDIMDRFYND